MELSRLCGFGCSQRPVNYLPTLVILMGAIIAPLVVSILGLVASLNVSTVLHSLPKYNQKQHS